MIIKQEPMSMAEVKGMLTEEKTEMEKFVKTFTKMKPDEAKKMREDLDKLEIIKMKPETIVKVIDLLPEDASDLNKIFIDVSLNEDEINKILGVVKTYK
jgi:DNA-directed RNA polymerase subunit F